MNIFAQLKIDIQEAIKNLHKQGKIASVPDFARLTTEPPKETAFGDVATNAALVLSGQVGLKPRDFAAMLCEELGKNDKIKRVEIAGPGFINMFLSSSYLMQQVQEILKEQEDYGNSQMGQGEKVNVEFVSVNPTGPMHVGHVRGAVFGDALASLLQKVGYDVTREYYVNDLGAQMDKLARSTYLRYREACGEDIGEIPEGCYPGEYVKDIAKSILSKEGDKYLNIKEEDCHLHFRDVAREHIMNWIKKDLEDAGIHFDVFTSEKAIAESGGVEAALKVLDNRGLIYKGFLEKPKSAKAPEDWSPAEMTIFKSTAFGDETDRPVKRADGTYTYFMPDIAYQYDKFSRGFKKLIMVLGADHAGYVLRLQSAVKAVTDGQADLQCKLVQMVSFSENGQPYKMSKRAGSFVLFSDLLNQLGKDLVRFFMLTRKNDTQLDFDFVKVKEQSKDNLVFYVQYAHARAFSVFRHAQDMFGKDVLDRLSQADLSLLTDETELQLARTLATYPRQVEQAAALGEPHRIAYYLYDVASTFHALWNKGRENVQMRFLDEQNEDLSLARLALVRAMTFVVASGLKIFGVQPVEEM